MTDIKYFGPEDLTIWLRAMPNQPRCFCGQLAVPTKTCHYHALVCPEKHFHCGFHIHLNTWNQFREQIKEGKLDPFHPELSSCPLFNFTFCTIFNIKNQLKMETPRPPDCQCLAPMSLHVFKVNNRYRTVFACHYRFEKTYCNTFFHAEDVVFERGDELLAQFTPEKRKEEDIQIYHGSTPKEVQEKPYQNVVTRNTTRSTEINQHHCLIEKTRNQVAKLYHQQQSELDSMRQDVEALKETVHRLETLVDNEHRFHLQFKQESEELRTLIKHLMEQIKMQDDMKCVVCFQNKVEVAIIPCYHFAFCEECADKLLECAICRSYKQRTQKIFMS
ncbi:hypothetical protein K501DRAFT_334849 [Backusella circina FSU 941]|nr:hypothetical protein K501DRAFT_334849 [Backusella circina FSU 941]